MSGGGVPRVHAERVRDRLNRPQDPADGSLVIFGACSGLHVSTAAHTVPPNAFPGMPLAAVNGLQPPGDWTIPKRRRPPEGLNGAMRSPRFRASGPLATRVGPRCQWTFGGTLRVWPSAAVGGSPDRHFRARAHQGTPDRT